MLCASVCHDFDDKYDYEGKPDCTIEQDYFFKLYGEVHRVVG